MLNIDLHVSFLPFFFMNKIISSKTEFGAWNDTGLMVTSYPQWDLQHDFSNYQYLLSWILLYLSKAIDNGLLFMQQPNLF